MWYRKLLDCFLCLVTKIFAAPSCFNAPFLVFFVHQVQKNKHVTWGRAFYVLTPETTRRISVKFDTVRCTPRGAENISFCLFRSDVTP
jgi:hypothetical protein